MKNKVSIALPLYNEEKNVEILHDRITKVIKKLNVDYQIIFSDNFSTDKTRSKIRELAKIDKNVKGIFLSKNFGHQANLRAAMSQANGDVLITMDGDLQDPPEFIENIYNKYLESLDSKRLEIINTFRTKRKGENFFRLFFIKTFYFLCRVFISKNIKYNIGDFRLYAKKVYQLINEDKNKNIFLRSYVNEIGFNSTSIPYIREPRAKENSKMNFLNLAKDGIDGIISSSNRLLRYISLIASAISILLLIKIILNFPINLNLILQITLVFIILSLGVIAEYIANIYNEIRKKPAYIIDEIIN